MRFLSWLPFILLTGCTATQRMSTLDPKGPIADMQLDLFLVTLWVTTFLFLTVGGTLLYTLIRFREKPEDKNRPMPTQSHGNPLIELALIGFSVVCLVVIAVPTVRGIWMMEVLPEDPETEVIEVDVKGYQWWWSFDYPDLGITTANELVIPKDRVVKLNLRSADVIHSFWVPKIAGKVDLMPGRRNWMWIMADEAGHYYGQCAEYCGEAHAYMLFRTDVLTEEEWKVWVAHQREDAEPPSGTDSWPDFFSAIDNTSNGFSEDPVRDGARIFMSQEGGCIQCHTIGGAKDANDLERAAGILGPNLTHVAGRKSLGAGLLENRGPDGSLDTRRQLGNFHKWVSASDTIKPGNLMYEEVRKKNLSKRDFERLAAFLQTLK